MSRHQNKVKNEDNIKNEADLEMEDNLKNWSIPQKNPPSPDIFLMTSHRDSHSTTDV